ncbi:MAG: glycoside hydrolase family 97 catalytic domain-containing protein [Acidobacteria bacterium]|nr:glycoside hydrolase family 97 catalytic domain-containing protein [Acidobacteriota bacterium]
MDRFEGALDLYAKWGAAGIKVDFMDRDDQQMVALYERNGREAAARWLLVTFHGALKPTGLRRVWLNLMAQEGVMGAEYSKWSEQVMP